MIEIIVTFPSVIIHASKIVLKDIIPIAKNWVSGAISGKYKLVCNIIEKNSEIYRLNPIHERLPS